MANLLYNLPCGVWILAITCLPWTAAQTVCRTSPVFLNSSLISGPATIFLPDSLADLTVSVVIRKFSRDGSSIFKLSPLVVNGKKCITKPHLCYRFSEIHWVKAAAEGSDHTIDGKRYPVEIQHYFDRTNKTHNLTPLGVGVLYERNEKFQVASLKSDTDSKHVDMTDFDQNHEVTRTNAFSHKILKEDKILEMKLGYMLPENLQESRFFQYRGSISGACSEERDWIVYEDPIIIPSFLDFLRSLVTDGYLNNFKISAKERCVLHSHYAPNSRECDGDFAKNMKRLPGGSLLAKHSAGRIERSENKNKLEVAGISSAGTLSSGTFSSASPPSLNDSTTPPQVISKSPIISAINNSPFRNTIAQNSNGQSPLFNASSTNTILASNLTGGLGEYTTSTEGAEVKYSSITLPLQTANDSSTTSLNVGSYRNETLASGRHSNPDGTNSDNDDSQLVTVKEFISDTIKEAVPDTFSMPDFVIESMDTIKAKVPEIAKDSLDTVKKSVDTVKEILLGTDEPIPSHKDEASSHPAVLAELTIVFLSIVVVWWF